MAEIRDRFGFLQLALAEWQELSDKKLSDGTKEVIKAIAETIAEHMDHVGHIAGQAMGETMDGETLDSIRVAVLVYILERDLKKIRARMEASEASERVH